MSLAMHSSGFKKEIKAVTPGYIPMRNKNICLHKNLYLSVLSRTI